MMHTCRKALWKSRTLNKSPLSSSCRWLYSYKTIGNLELPDWIKLSSISVACSRSSNDMEQNCMMAWEVRLFQGGSGGLFSYWKQLCSRISMCLEPPDSLYGEKLCFSYFYGCWIYLLSIKEKDKQWIKVCWAWLLSLCNWANDFAFIRCTGFPV